MRYIYRFFQLVFLLLIALSLFFVFSSDGRKFDWTTHTIILSIFISIILLLEFIIRIKCRAKKDDTQQANFDPKPLELKFSKNFVIGGLILMAVLLFVVVSAFWKAEYILSAASFFMAYLFFKFGHLGDIRFWNHRLVRIDSTGITHYKYNFIPWEKVSRLRLHTSRYRGMKVGKSIYVSLTSPLTPSQSNFRKKWAGVLFTDPRFIVIPASFFTTVPTEIAFKTMDAFFKQSGGVDLELLKQQLNRVDELMKQRNTARQNDAGAEITSKIDLEIENLIAKTNKNIRKIDQHNLENETDPILKNLYKTEATLEKQHREYMQKMDHLLANPTEEDIHAANTFRAMTQKLSRINEELTQIRQKIMDRTMQLQNRKLYEAVLAVFVGTILVAVYIFLKS